MAYIKINTKYPIYDGMSVTFKAPCDCTRADGLSVNSTIFEFKDAHGVTLAGIENLFTAGALVKVILDVTNGSAYIQNADTNAYLEGKLNERSGIRKASGYWTSPCTVNCGFTPDVVFISDYNRDRFDLDQYEYSSKPAIVWCTDHPYMAADSSTLLLATENGFLVGTDEESTFNETDHTYHYLAVKFG